MYTSMVSMQSMNLYIYTFMDTMQTAEYSSVYVYLHGFYAEYESVYLYLYWYYDPMLNQSNVYESSSHS